MGTKKGTEKTYELKYTGWLKEQNSPIYLHYGIENWSDVSENKMRKLKNCYKTEITVPEKVSSISFCFRDSNGNWDNNQGNDYWYTPSIGETYSCVEVLPADATSKASSAIKKTVSKVSRAKKAVKKED